MSRSQSSKPPYEIIEQQKEIYLKEEVNEPSPDWPPDVQEAYKIVRKQLFDMNLDVNTVIEQCKACSNSGTQSRFRHFVGYGIKELIINHRLAIAKRLLHNEDLSITKIALSIGYDTPSGFSTTFKRREGAAPSTVREKTN